MTQVDFYLVQNAAEHARDLVACRLAEKAVSQGHDVYIHTGSRTHAAALDDLLWSFRPGSFLAHELVEEAAPGPAPVWVGYGFEPDASRAVLINLHAEVPLFFSRFERVLEIVYEDERAKNDGRARYGYYRDRGYPLQYHRVNA